MYTYTTTILVIAVGILTVSAQYQQPSSANYVEDYADYEAGRPAAHAAPRSYDSGATAAQRAAPATPKPTPVAILKQINRHNEDGSYTYGFEGADGSFKIETKLPNGEVKGKYGFVDDTGVARVVEYGADQYGFQPAGDGITVAPPTLVDETTSKEALEAQAYQDYQDALQRQQAAAAAARPAPAAAARPQPAAAPRPQYTQAIYSGAQPSAPSAPSTPSAPKPPIFTPSASGAFLSRGQQQDYNAPRQSQLLQVYDEPSPPSQVYNQGPAQFSPAPVQEHRSQPQTRSHQAGTRGILDQLARDYALPQNSAAPLHDISFGYY